MRWRVILLAALAAALLLVQQNIGQVQRLLQLTRPFEVPLAPLVVAVVEEHHHAVQYWVKHPGCPATVIHIDAHSDLGLPNQLPSQLPSGITSAGVEAQQAAQILAESNDNFLVAAVLTGWVKHVTWVWPSWLPMAWWPGEPTKNRTHPELQHDRKVYGTTHPLHTYPCGCSATINGSSNCFAINSVGDEVPIGPETCRLVPSWTLEVLTLPSPSPAIPAIPLPAGEEYLLDIDEDFFGVESPFLQLEEAGIPVTQVNGLLEAALCPATETEEQVMDEVLCSALHTLVEYNAGEQYDWDTLPPLLHRSLTAADIHTCPGHPDRLLDQLTTFVEFARHNMSHPQRQLLRSYGFCRDREGSGFLVVCVGFSSAGDQDQSRVALISTNRLEVAQRLVALETLLQQLPRPPQLVTISRSVKDGYTPRSLWAFIEARLLHVLRRCAANGWRRTLHVTFDERLWGGSAGCVGRPLAVFPLPHLKAHSP